MNGQNRSGPKLPPGVMRGRVSALFNQGLSQREIACRLGVGKSTVAFHVRRMRVPPNPRFARRYDWKAIRIAYDAGLSKRQCMQRFGFSSEAWRKAVQRGDLVPRPTAMPIDELLVVGRRTSRTHLKHRLIREGLKSNACELCGLTQWLGNSLSMHLHHINGEGADNRLENLELLCPNCHSQTDTYGGRNGHRRSKAHLRLVEGTDEQVA